MQITRSAELMTLGPIARTGLLLLALTCARCESDHSPLVDAENASGSFCQRLADIIVQGTSTLRDGGRFSMITGSRISPDTYTGLITLVVSSGCFVIGGRSDRVYRCNYGDAGIADVGELRHRLNLLSSQTEACIARGDTFGYSRRGVTMPRYFLDSESSTDDVEFIDRWRQQTVKIRIEREGQGARLNFPVDAL